MGCPYPNCGGDLRLTNEVGHCLKCAQPVFLCPQCSIANRSFARHCRRCCADIEYPSETFRHLRDSDQGPDLSTPPRAFHIRKSFWVSPIAYRGFLWCLSTTGELFAVSPFGVRAVPWGLLGAGFGRAPFIIRELRLKSRREQAEPFALAANSKSIAAVNLLTREPQVLLTLEQGEQLLADFSERYVTLEADEQSLYFLKKKGGAEFLVTYDLMRGVTEEFAVPSPGAAGPLWVGGSIAVYTRDRVYVLEEGGLRQRLEFGSFAAWGSPAEVRDVQPPFGRVPYLRRRDSVYLPGVRGNESGLLFISSHGPVFSQAFISSQGEACYGQDAEGRLVTARAGEMVSYEETSPVLLKSDNQITPKGQPFHNRPLTVGFVRAAGGAESIRFYWGSNVSDYPLAPLRAAVDVGFFAMGDTFTFIFLTERDGESSMGGLVWDV